MGGRRPKDHIPAILAAVHRSILLRDDAKLFVFVYVGLAVVLALWAPRGWAPWRAAGAASPPIHSWPHLPSQGVRQG
jgi:hypothetical protein